MRLATSEKTVVVAAASRHGATCEIADRIADQLVEALPDHWLVVRVGLGDLRVFDGADAVVLGSAIYYGHWMHSAGSALKYLRSSPPPDLWLFSSGPVSDVDSETAHIISADDMVEFSGADEHHVFGGSLQPPTLGFVERMAAKAVHALPGDHRDLAEVDAWATHIADALIAGEAAAQVRQSV